MADEVITVEEQILELQVKLAELRRRAPKEPVGQYHFDASDGSAPVLSELFGDHRDLIIVHNMGKSCTYCTLWADGFNGILPHIESRCAFVVVSPDDPQEQRDFAVSRGWKFRMVSCRRNSFAADMGFVREPEGYWPGMSAFHKGDDGMIVRTGKTSLGPGDNYCAIWHMFALLADGVAGWEPQYSYKNQRSGSR